jgi:putative endonuclease
MKRFTSKTQQLGEKGEALACNFLVKQGYRIIERNVPNKYGEIDIVAKKGTVVHFFEVKATKEGSWFNPADNLNPVKLHKFLISAEYYAYVRRIADYRVQGILVWVPREDGGEGRVEMIDVR